MAKRPLEYDDAIVTSLVRYGEADCIVRLFCRTKGRVSAFAKNGLKPSKSRGGVLQAPAFVRVGLVQSPQAALMRLAEIDVKGSSFLLASNLKAFGWACYLAEIVETLVAEEDVEHEGFFELFQTSLELVAQQKASASTLRAFELRLLKHCGYLPDLNDVVDEPGQMVRGYDTVNGHLLATASSNAAPFDESARKAALVLAYGPIEAAPDIDRETLQMVGRIFSSRLKQMSKRPLKSVEFLRNI